MTVFTCVTATLSPELASCMKAKGKTWKEAFFDSLKTLVGVEYTIYRRENQWQIKGEWDGIKKAHNILSKVAVIEKDAIAAYQAESLRARELASPATSPTLTDTGRRRRGRPPKKRPYIPIPVEVDNQETPLPPKRKRGRPRKVRVEEVKVESDIDDHELLQSPNEMVNSEVVQNPINAPEYVNSTNVTEALTVEMTEPNKASDVGPQAANPVPIQHQPTSGEVCEQPPIPENHTLTQPEPEVSSIAKVDPTPQLEERTLNASLASQEHAIEGVHIQNQTPKMEIESEVVEDGRGQTLAKHPDPAPEPKEQSLNDHFSDVVIAVAKEAIACASHHGGPPAIEPSADGTIPIQSVQMQTPQPSLSSEQTSQLIAQAEMEPSQSATIFDYLGIKQKNAVDEFAGQFEEDNERYSSEQSKKLEELIEKMIEKMDKTLKEPKPSTTGLKYICTECPFTSQKKSSLRDHMRTAHTNEDAAEQEETEPTSSEIPVPQKKFLGPRKLYRCFECNYSSNSRKHLKEHRMRKHREKVLECQVCNKKFAVERDLSRHMKEHESGDVRYTCDVCGKKYKQHYVLKRHMETHEDGYIKPVFPCTECSKTFAAKQVLQIHINSVHLGKRPSYPCPTCGKTFTTKHSLAEHQLIHSNAKPYECTICKKAFRHESTLKTHQRLHTDTSQRFTCEYCGKAFRLRSSLRIHRNIHTGDKRFDCPICKKVFTQKQSLLRHARIHTGEKPFQCEICGSAFYDYSILRRHVTGVHKMQWKSPTQHYVLPPGSYQDGKVIEQPPQDTQVTQVAPPHEVAVAHVAHLGEGLHAATLSGHAHHVELQHHQQQQQAHQQQQQQHHHQHHQPPAPQGHVYQPPPMPHTPHTLPEPAHTSQQQPLQAHNLSSRHLQVADHQTLEGKVVSTSSSDQQQQQATYHSSIVSQNVYQPPHIPLPNTVPSALPLTQPQPLQSPPPPQHHPQPLQSPPPPQHPMSPLPPMSPMSLAQYQQTQAHRTTPQPALSLPSAYSLNQQIYYQSHP